MKQYFFTKQTAFFCLIALLLFVAGCKEDLGISVNKVGEKPAAVSNVQVTPVSGGATLKYDLPLSEDLRYVKAVYTLDNGVKREAKASIYKNEITVDGFGKEGTYSVTLYAVSVGEIESEAVTVPVTVLRPPYLIVLDKIKNNDNVVATFGGLNLNYTNDSKSDIIIKIVKKDSLGKWIPVDDEYTNFPSGTIRIRGQNSVATDFGIFIQDRWDHSSDTFNVRLTPLEEVRIPSTGWKRFFLPSDAGERASGFPFTGIWDGNVNAGYLSIANANAPLESITLPNSLTLDLGIAARFSRMQIWATRYSTASDVYGAAHLYEFEIYGSNAPNPNGQWDETWTRLGHFTSSRPSGFGFGVPATSAEITNIQQNGETYEFPDPTGFQKFRYIRFKNYATWNGAYEGGSNFFIFELRLFGQL
ncbi:DUF4959 domain-containing protein [Niabella sp. 22666]|uniref:DUF4959 domain-containing protein n=1 Tax=Niabella sp. 22666 TaxID=3453954 RepID=UPI003F84C965